MGTAKSPFQPGYDGKHTVPATRGRVMSHSHNAAGIEPADATGTGKCLARDSKVGKHHYPIEAHGGSLKISKSGAATYGGDHSSALDSLTGAEVVPGQVRSTPGWGNGDVRTGHPFAKAPASKQLKPVEIKPGMRSRLGETYNAKPGDYHNIGQIGRDANRDFLHRLGDKIMDEGLAIAGPDHPANLGRRK